MKERKMKSEIDYVGEYRLNPNGGHREPYWASSVSFKGVGGCVVDAAGADGSGRNFVRLLPYGTGCHALDGVVQDGDLLSYMQGPLTIGWPAQLSPNAVVNVLKGRASHAELGYAGKDGSARQVSLWGAPGGIRPLDRPFHEHACDDAISIYRVSLAGYGVDADCEQKLKAGVRRWKRIVQPVYFPCETMNLDPVDFTTVDELRRIAVEFVSHNPTVPRPPCAFKLNCVQWSTLVFSLAVCFPLSRTALASFGALEPYERNWAAQLGFAEDGLVGIGELPIPFYTVREAVENILDLYLPDVKSVVGKLIELPAVGQLMSRYGVSPTQRVVMPAAFMFENRLAAKGVARRTKSRFEYIATGFPVRDLVRVG